MIVFIFTLMIYYLIYFCRRLSKTPNFLIINNKYVALTSHPLISPLFAKSGLEYSRKLLLLVVYLGMGLFFVAIFVSTSTMQITNHEQNFIPLLIISIACSWIAKYLIGYLYTKMS